MWGVSMGYTKSTLGISVLFFLSVIVIMTGAASADIGIMAAGDVKFNLVSDNFSFNFTDLNPVVKGFNVVRDGGTYAPDRFNWTLKYPNGTTAVEALNSVSDNYSFTFPHPGQYSLIVMASNSSTPPNGLGLSEWFYPENTAGSSGVPVYARMPVLGQVVYWGVYNWEYQFGYTLDAFSAVPDLNNGLVWNFSDGSTDRSTYPNRINHTFPYSSPYEVKCYDFNVTAYNKTSDLVFLPNVSGDLTICIPPPPVSDFFIVDNNTKAPVRIAPVPAIVDFINNSSTFPSYGGSPLAFEWNLSDGSTHQTTENVTHYTFDKAGNYNVTLRTFSDLGWNETNKTLITYENISANFTTVQSPCAAFPVNVEFHDNSSGSLIDVWAWDFGDGLKRNVTTNQTKSYLLSARPV
jgi:hypothetical protein